MKKNVFIGLLVILLVFCFFGCDPESNDEDNVFTNGDNDPEIFTVIIGDLLNGSIIANPISGTEGTEITLTINPDDFYKLKVGTLKYGITIIDEELLKFNLPNSNIIINAQFESMFNGLWQNSNNILSINENIFIHKNIEGKYVGIGNWDIELPNKIIQTYSHYIGIGVENINVFYESSNYISNYIFEYTIESITNSLFEIIQYNSPIIWTIVIE